MAQSYRRAALVTSTITVPLKRAGSAGGGTRRRVGVGTVGVLTVPMPAAAQSYTLALPLRINSSSTYPNLERSVGSKLLAAAMNGTESTAAGRGPVPLGPRTVL